MSDSDRLLYELPCNVVVAAGAGTGKTHRLTGLFVHLVGGLTDVAVDGERADQPISPERIVATTFTRLAASEMRERIRARLELLAARGVEALASDDDPSVASWARELLATCERRRVSPPSNAVWTRALDALPRATIATFHSWAGEIVRRHPFEAGIAPGAELLEPFESRALAARTARAILVRWLDDDRPCDAALDVTRAALARSLVSDGLDRATDQLAQAIARATEDGLPVAALAIAEDAAAIASAQRRLLSLIDHVTTAARAAAPSASKKAAAPVAIDSVVERVRSALATGNVATLEELRACGAALHIAYGTFSRKSAHADAVEAIKEIVDAASGTYADKFTATATLPWLTREAGRRALATRALLDEIERALAAEKARLRVIDFGDMLARARTLLVDHPEVQASVSRDVAALLVDEFQDTNAVQRDLVYLVRQRAEAIAGRAPGSMPDATTLRPTGLFVVGDRKQSIYAFRGGEVAVFQQIAVDVADGAVEMLGLDASLAPARPATGKMVMLDVNRRSIAPILRFVNALSAVDMVGESALPALEQVRFVADRESLGAIKEARGDGPFVIAPTFDATTPFDAEAARAIAATGVAREIRALIDDPSIGGAEIGRPYVARDVAILVRNRTIAASLERALSMCDVPARVVGGRGLYASIEARDLEMLSRVLVDRRDRIALLAALRGPCVGLSDATLVALLDDEGLSLGPPRLPIPSDESERLRLFVDALDDAIAHAPMLGTARTLGRLVGAVKLEETLAMLPRGAARIAGLRRLLAIAEARDLRLSEWVAHLQTRREAGDDEATGLALDASDDAASIMTVHAAKGLEFPIVFVVQAELGAPDRDRASIVVGRTRGRLSLATALRSEQASGQGLVGRRMQSERAAALRAERQRLTYVALTRAASRLYVVASPIARDAKDSMMPALETVVAQRPELVSRPAWPIARPDAIARAPIDAPLDRDDFAGALRAASSDATVVTTALLDFSGCPRRFRLVHLDGLDDAIGSDSSANAIEPEDPVAPVVDASATPVVPLTLDRRALGTLAHRALERAPMTAMTSAAARAWVTDLLRVEGYEASDDTGRRLVDRVARFLSSTYARSLAEPGVVVAREVPFVVPLPSGARLRGTVDLVARRPGARPRIEVVDYKLGRGGVEAVHHYRPQLEAYAVAIAGDLDPASVDVAVGLAFLGSDSPEPIWLPMEGRLDAARARIDASAQALLAARAKAEYPGVGRDRCEAIGCGFLALCHGS